MRNFRVNSSSRRACSLLLPFGLACFANNSLNPAEALPLHNSADSSSNALTSGGIKGEVAGNFIAAAGSPANSPSATADGAKPTKPVKPPKVGSKKGASAESVQLRPPIKPEKVDLGHPLSINEAVKIADRNYPKVLRARIQMNASRDAVALQKVQEYVPDALFQYQQICASRNKLTQIMYGSPVFPGNPGPGLNGINMRPIFFCGAGFNLDWSPLDFGLHKSRINLSKANYYQSTQDVRVTELDAQLSAALNFLDAVVAKEQMKAAKTNVEAFEQIKTSVDAQVRAKLRAAADSYLAGAELARARTAMVRAELAQQVAVSGLANSLGVAGRSVDVNTNGLSGFVEKEEAKFKEPDFELTPLMSAGRAAISSLKAQRHVLDKQYAPTFHWLFGMQGRGSGLNIHAEDQSGNLFGFVPNIPNYQIALIVNWNFLDFARLHYEKKISDKRIRQSQLDLDLVKNNLITEDVQTRAQLDAAYKVVENTKVQLEAAEMALKQSQARYNNGLSSVVQLAESSQALAQARLELATAHVGIWKVLLSMSALRGDLKPFLALAQKVEGGP